MTTWQLNDKVRRDGDAEMAEFGEAPPAPDRPGDADGTATIDRPRTSRVPAHGSAMCRAGPTHRDIVPASACNGDPLGTEHP
jgi:hypothetical protein